MSCLRLTTHSISTDHLPFLYSLYSICSQTQFFIHMLSNLSTFFFFWNAQIPSSCNVTCLSLLLLCSYFPLLFVLSIHPHIKHLRTYSLFQIPFRPLFILLFLFLFSNLFTLHPFLVSPTKTQAIHIPFYASYEFNNIVSSYSHLVP